ncbi:MAG TPA: restriction endonuclease [Candidatus Saccharimonadales bacterium]|nr:restriction endonuclease [Candidatus Saccharimonadales bacterium]
MTFSDVTPIPDYETLMLPLLKLASENPSAELRVLDATNLLASKYRLTPEERSELLPSGATFKFSSRVSWAATYLKKAGLLESRSRGYVRITLRGLEALKRQPSKIDGDLLSQYEDFRQFRDKNKKDKNSSLSENSETPIESIDAQYRKVREALASELLEKVKKCSPQFFERLVISVLVKMGYGGSLKDAGLAIGRSGDGGVDGVIKEDKLGLDNIYIQAKRWADKCVGSPDIDQFVGALSKKKANKGIFLTTSTFSKDALASVEKYEAKIVLLDGVQVANLMIDYGVGVSIDQIYEIKKMDYDFFEDDDAG